KKLQSVQIDPDPQVSINQFRPLGQKFQSLAVLGKEWVTAGIGGKGSYTELIYPLSSVLTTAVITTPATGTASRKWTFTPAIAGDDTPKTYSIEHGSAFRADKFNYGIFTDFGMKFTRDSIDLSGSLMGRAITDGIS